MSEEFIEAENSVTALRRHAEELSKCEIRFDVLPANVEMISTTEIAWKRNRNFHVIKVNETLDEPVKLHSHAHEIYHIILEAEARAIGRNQQVTFTNEDHMSAVESIAEELGALCKIYPDMAEMGPVVQRLIEDTVNLLYNASLDIIIEDLIFRKHSELHVVQKSGELHALKKNFGSISDEVTVQILPATILKLHRLLHAGYAFSVNKRWNDSLNATEPYLKYNIIQQAEQFFSRCEFLQSTRSPGDEYTIIKDIADELGIKHWFTMQPDPTQ